MVASPTAVPWNSSLLPAGLDRAKEKENIYYAPFRNIPTAFPQVFINNIWD